MNYLKTLTIIFYSLIFCASSSYSQKQDMPPVKKGIVLQSPFYERTERWISSVTTMLFDETFESGGTAWLKTGSWQIGNPTSGPNSGYNSAKCAATNLSGNYQNNARDTLRSSIINLPALGSATHITLKFHEWYQTESGYDVGYVKISTNGGAAWVTLDSRSGSSSWRQTEVDLTSYANKNISLMFNFYSDGSAVYAGWYVDNVQIIKNDPEPITVSLSSLNSQSFPFVYMNVGVDTFATGITTLTQSSFEVYENNTLQTDYFQVIPPDTGAGVRLADIIFVLDVTGSMSEEISATKTNMLSFVNSLATSDIDYSIGIVVFGDVVYTYNSGNLYNNQSQILSVINAISLGEHGIGGGGDTPENQLSAMYTATQMNFRPGAQRIQILLTDADAHANDGVTTWSVSALIPILQSANFTVYPVFDINNSAQRNQYIPIAEATNPRKTYFHIYDNFNGITNEISSSISNTYVVSYRSSNPVSDGTLRNVRVRVTYKGNSDTATGSYIPGSAPTIQRTTTTLTLHEQPWAEGTVFTIEADVMDNVSPFVQQAILYYKRSGTSAYTSVTMAKQSGNTYRGIIPASSVTTPGMDYYITATDGISTSSDPKTNPSTLPYQIAILPNVAPAITHTPMTTLTPGTAITITATIVDNTNSLATKKLYYRKTGQLLYQQVAMTNTTGSVYQATIPAGYVTVDGVEYYIYASDNFGVSSTHGTADVPHSIEPRYDLGFRPNPNGWSFHNNSEVWPYYWIPFRDPIDEFCLCLPTRCFPTWELFREAFGREQVEYQNERGEWLRRPSAETRWNGIKGCWGGSCFGFAITSFLFFDNFASLTNLLPGNTNVFTVPLQDDSRRLINVYFIYQFGFNQLEHIKRKQTLTPIETLNEIKQMSLSSTRNDKILVFFHQNGSGGHAVNPYKVTVGGTVDTVWIYDNNAPNVERKIWIDKVANTWNYPNMPNWGGQSGLFLMEPVGDYLNHPILPKEVPRRDRHITASAIDNPTNIEIYNTECNITVIGVNGDSMGYSLQTGKVFSIIDDGMPIIPITGSVHYPLGYYLPEDTYRIQLSNYADTVNSFAVLSDSLVITMDRGKTNSRETDKIFVDLQNASIRLINADTSNKIYNTQSIIITQDSEKIFSIKNCNIQGNDSLVTQLFDRKLIHITNKGDDKSYDLILKISSEGGELTFEHKNITLSSNSAHLVSPEWSELTKRDILILVDNNINHTWDDTLNVNNQYTGDNSPAIVGSLSDQNIYSYPNPFNPEYEQTKFRFKLRTDGNVSITVYDVSSVKVREVIAVVSMSGGEEQSVAWDGRNTNGDVVANGVYFYVIESSSGERAVGKVAVLR